MKPKQAFGLIVRVLGLMFILTGLVFLLCSLVWLIAPNYPNLEMRYDINPQTTQNWQFVLFGIGLALLGYVILRCARPITRLGYKTDDPDA